MENSKLMTPLFFDGNFNREGRRMRAVFVREITNGTDTYRLWRSAGKPDLDYPRAENDKYILHAEINGYLLPLRMTDYSLIDHCGFKPAVQELYGGADGRRERFDALRKSGDEKAVPAALEAERREIERLGGDPAVQADYIKKVLSEHVETYLAAKANGGITFPDFYGAAVVNDLDRCSELSAVYRAVKEEMRCASAAKAAEEEKQFCEEENKKAERLVSDAIQTIRGGGVLTNEKVTFYRDRYDSSSYSIINYLMRQYGVDVPLRTQGWINEMLSSVTIADGRCTYLRYLRSKNGRGSQKFFQCMNELIRAVTAQTAEKGKEEDAA